MKLQPAAPEDLPAIVALLAAVSLDASDLTPAHTGDFLLLVGDGTVAACGAIQRFDRVGLLRSVAVRPGNRNQGLATRLVRSLETQAHTRGIRDVFLLTTTASAFFARLHYDTCPRDSAPEAIQNSPQFANLCPASATCMRKQLSALKP